jgi:hypothetical protein
VIGPRNRARGSQIERALFQSALLSTQPREPRPWRLRSTAAAKLAAVRRRIRSMAANFAEQASWPKSTSYTQVFLSSPLKQLCSTLARDLL